jgi:hypothetical protein
MVGGGAAPSRSAQDAEGGPRPVLVGADQAGPLHGGGGGGFCAHAAPFLVARQLFLARLRRRGVAN